MEGEHCECLHTTTQSITTSRAFRHGMRGSAAFWNTRAITGHKGRPCCLYERWKSQRFRTIKAAYTHPKMRIAWKSQASGHGGKRGGCQEEDDTKCATHQT